MLLIITSEGLSGERPKAWWTEMMDSLVSNVGQSSSLSTQTITFLTLETDARLNIIQR